ncbi:unnamed protein product [Mucor fragilis]
MCSSLATFTVHDSLLSGFVIGMLLNAAATFEQRISFIVPARCLNLWMSVLNKQKFRAGALSVRCHFSDSAENEQEKLAVTTTIEDLVKSEGYGPFSIKPHAEHEIVQDLENVVFQLGESLAGGIFCFSEAKFLITSLDAFVHIKDIDNCSFNNITPFVKLHRKFEKGGSLFEVSVIVHGCIELLAIGGLIYPRRRM